MRVKRQGGRILKVMNEKTLSVKVYFDFNSSENGTFHCGIAAVTEVESSIKGSKTCSSSGV